MHISRTIDKFARQTHGQNVMTRVVVYDIIIPLIIITAIVRGQCVFYIPCGTVVPTTHAHAYAVTTVWRPRAYFIEYRLMTLLYLCTVRINENDIRFLRLLRLYP